MRNMNVPQKMKFKQIEQGYADWIQEHIGRLVNADMCYVWYTVHVNPIQFLSRQESTLYLMSLHAALGIFVYAEMTR